MAPAPRLRYRSDMGVGRGKLAVALGCAAIVIAMTTLVAFSLPLYRAFCAATGLAGTTRRVERDTAAASARTITVRFNTDVAPGLPWKFGPGQDQVTVHLGVPTQISFWAENLSDAAIVGHATYNVTPELAGRYFNKIQCFCFDEEKLGAHERVEMPVIFYVDPSILDDKDVGHLPTLTLSYTFFRSTVAGGGAKDLARFGASNVADAAITGNPAHGAEVFAGKCAACHALDHNRVGPMLGGLGGREAGKAAGFDYSTALAASAITWNAKTLDQWLTDPRADVPGARMPISVPDAQTRADVIAYLLEQHADASGGN
jgi:cytochrome c oxidase assembly protein Cox11/cytochrome c2